MEYITRQAQLALRSPWFLLAFNVVTLALMIVGWREQWNYLASWLAIMVEWIVGTFMFGQTKRDALVLRETRALAERISNALATVAHDVERIEDVVVDENQWSGAGNSEERAKAIAAARDEKGPAQRH